jgi:uncharacterized protein (TIGR00369 family)
VTEEGVRADFAKQPFMRTLGARLARVEDGAVEIELPFDDRLTQQHTFLHAGAVASILDSACGYAALTQLPDGSGVLTVEFKISLLRPAVGELVRARGRVVRAGRTLTTCLGEAVAVSAGAEKTVATMLATLIAAPAA